MIVRKLCVAVGTLVAGASPVLAAGTGGCESFAWPLKTEIAWMTSSDRLAVESGAKLDEMPGKAMNVALQPQADVKLSVPSSGAPKSKPETAYAGTVEIAGGITPGTYQVTLSAGGWIDVVQNGSALVTTEHTGKSDCPGVRKSVRFNFADRPVTLQLTNVASPNIVVTVRPAK